VALVQVTLVALLGLAAWLAVRRSGPALRGAVLLAALLGLLVVPGLAAVAPVWLPLPEWVFPAVGGPALADPGDAVRAPPARSAADPVVQAIVVAQVPPRAPAGPEDLEQLGKTAGPAQGKAKEVVVNLSFLPQDAAPAEPPGNGGPAPRRSPLSWPLAGVLAAVWLLGALVCLSHALGRLALLYRCARRARPVGGEEWTDRVASLAARCGVRAVALRESPAITSPLTLGLFRPVILLPLDRRHWPAAQRALILGHEFAHVRRRDFLAGLVAELAACLCWFHPLVRWLTARLRLEQEYAADAWVASALTDSADYVRFLARLALEQGRGRASLAPAFWRRRPEILRRIDMLRRHPHGQPPWLKRQAAWTVAVLAAAACLVVAGVGPLHSAADNPKTAAPEPEAKRKPTADLYGDPLPAGALARLGTTRLRHGGDVTFVAFGRDGKTLLTAGQDNTLRVWDLASGREIRRFARPRPANPAPPAKDEKAQAEAMLQLMAGGRNGGGGFGVALSPDGKTLAAAGGGVIQLWKVESGEELLTIQGPAAGVAGLLFSPDGRTLAARAGDGTLVLWAADTGKELQQIKPAERPKGNGVVLILGGGGDADAPGMAFTPDGKLLAASAADYDKEETLWSVKLWDVASGKEMRRIKGPDGARVSSVAVTPDGNLLAYGAGNAVHLCAADTAKEVRQLKGADGGILGLVFSPDGKTLAVHGGNRRVHLWQTDTGKELRQLGDSEPADGDGGLAFFADGIGDLETRALAISPDGKRIAAAAANTFRLWETATGKELPLLGGHQQAPSEIILSADGKTVVSWGADRVLRRWEAATGKSLGDFPAPAGTTLAALSPDGRTIALANEDNTIRLHDTTTGKELRRFKGHPNGLAGLAFAPDGKVLASRGSSDNTVRLYDAVHGVEGQQITMRPVNNPDGGGAFLIIGGGRRRSRGTGPGLAFAPDGKLVVARGPGNALVFLDVTAGKEIRKIAPPQAVTGFAFSPDGRTLATENADRTITLWEVASGKERGRLGKPSEPQPQGGRMTGLRLVINGVAGGDFTEPSGPVGIAFSPDGRALAARGPDRSVHLWDMAAGKDIGQLKGHEGAIDTVAFAPDGKELASGAGDTTILLWDAAGPLNDLSKPQQIELRASEVEALWSDLSGDAAKALLSVNKLAAAPKQVVPFLSERLKPAARIDPRKIDGWIADLESEKFTVRQEAAANLLKAGEQALPALQKVLASSPPLETRKRADSLVDQLTGGGLTPEQLQTVRAVEALERMGTPEARRLLGTLAEGAPGALPTREAQAALGRMKDGK
jgi:WD40 repeat protein/beta-lactamase regulating signal transducer with metallopeptidase domain